MNERGTRWVAGCMTGTSLDGIDVALVEITGEGLAMRAVFRGMVSRPLGSLGETLRHFAEGGSAPPIEYMKAARALGELHAEAAAELCARFRAGAESPGIAIPGLSPGVSAGGAPLSFIVAHGQTIWHAPTPMIPEESRKTGKENGIDEPLVNWTGGEQGSHSAAELKREAAGRAGLSWQLFDPWPLVRKLRAPVCFDLRQADLIAGGQGAPITPLADFILYRSATRPAAIVNLGGICNVTLLHDRAEDTAGRDVGPCNILLDAVVQRLYPGKRYDEDGGIAKSGKVIDMLKQAVVIDALAILKEQRSLGREQFPLSVIDGWLATAKKYETNEDIVASYTAAVADLVCIGIGATAKKTALKQVILAGGGARNPVLVEAISKHDMLSVPVALSESLGIPCDAREAAGFAVLGALSHDGVPITLPAVTGATNPGRAGAWVYP